MTQAAQLAQYGASSVGLAFKNRIINGAMVIDQRNAGASVTANYPVDRWRADTTGQASFSLQQNAGSVTPPAGFTNYLGCTSTTAYSPASNTTFLISQLIEGFNTADLNWGSANAQTVTLSFWVRSSLTGTHSGALSNGAANIAYVYSFAISSANIWEYKTITIPGSTTGTWNTTNGIGAAVRFNLGTGTGTYGSTTIGWQSGNIVGLSNAVQVSATNGATFYITGVQLEVGSTATSFDTRSYGTELALCQRYYQFVGGDAAAGFPLLQGYTTAGNNIDTPISFPVSMRTTPTTSVTGTWAVDNTVQPTIIFPNAQGFAMRITATATGRVFAYPAAANNKMIFSAEL